MVRVLPRHILHGNEVNSVCFIDIVNGHNVGMAQRGSGLGFLHETSLSVRIGYSFRGKGLWGYQAVDRTSRAL